MRKKHCWCDPSQLAFDGLSKSDIFQFAFQSVCVCVCVVYLCVFGCICVNGCVCACLFVSMPICLSFTFSHFMIVGGLSSVYLIFCLFVSLFVCLSVCLLVRFYFSQSALHCKSNSLFICSYVCFYFMIQVYFLALILLDVKKQKQKVIFFTKM